MVLDEALVIAKLLADGDISPDMLQGLQDAAILQEAAGNHYDMEELVRGKKEDRGKFKLTPKQLRGGTNLAQTLDGLLMAAQVERTGEPVVASMGETPQSQRVRMAGERILAPAGASQLAKVGLRAGAVEQLDGAERLNRALDRLVEMDRNFDPTSGARLDGIGLDGGHKFAHHAHPEMSSSRENMQMENKYVNRVKGAAEGDAAVGRFKNSLLKRLKSGATTPAELVNRYQYNEPQIEETTSRDGERLVGDTNDNQGKVIKMTVDTQGGDFNLDSGFKKRRGL